MSLSLLASPSGHDERVFWTIAKVTLLGALDPMWTNRRCRVGAHGGREMQVALPEEGVIGRRLHSIVTGVDGLSEGSAHMLAWVRMVTGMVGDGWWRTGLDGWGK